MAKQFEYEEFCTKRDRSVAEDQKALNDLGKQGWEAYAVERDTADGELIYYLRREIESVGSIDNPIPSLLDLSRVHALRHTAERSVKYGISAGLIHENLNATTLPQELVKMANVIEHNSESDRRNVLFWLAFYAGKLMSHLDP